MSLLLCGVPIDSFPITKLNRTTSHLRDADCSIARSGKEAVEFRLFPSWGLQNVQNAKHDYAFREKGKPAQSPTGEQLPRCSCADGGLRLIHGTAKARYRRRTIRRRGVSHIHSFPRGA